MKRALGFTLVEVMISTAILVVALVSTLEMFVYSLAMAGGDRDLAITQSQAAQQMEQLYSLEYDILRSTYTNAGALKETPFDIRDINGKVISRMKGSIYAEELSGAAYGLMRVKAVVGYRQNNNRIIGEDTNLNGRLDVGEDKNGNGELDSPCEIETVIAYK